MYYLIIFLPLMSAIITLCAGRLIGEKGAGILTTSTIFLTSLLSWISFYEVGLSSAPTYLKLWTWIDSGLFNVSLSTKYDTLTVSMLILVTTISALVHLYSTGYMAGDPHLPRFMSYLSLFTFFMIVLVTGDNLLQLFIGWEGVGLCSYLLINFWWTRIQANKSAMKAMIVNRVGDVGLALGLFLTYTLFKSLDYDVIFSSVDFVYNDPTIKLWLGIGSKEALTLIGLFLLIGAVGKSAQLGLHTWLPDAMEGPTPVSALIHAATMVTAGVFLLIRCGALLEYAPTALATIVIVGALTAFFAASVGLLQNDIKKVIAYSTCSQLGYMVFACGLSSYGASLFHLINHGFFKALLFLSAGSVIHAMADEQDMRKFGALISSLPFTYSMMLIGSLSLMGFPFMTGFYSKDAILELAYAKFTFEGTFAYWLGTVSAFFTSFYSIRLIYLTFLSPSNSILPSFKSAHENPLSMSLPLFILSIFSIFAGYLWKDSFIGLGSTFFGANPSTSIWPEGSTGAIDAEFLSDIKYIPVVSSLSGALLALILSPNLLFSLKFTPLGMTLYTFINNKWHWDQVYNAYIAYPLFKFGHDVSYKILDRGIIELFGPKGIASLIKTVSNFSSSLQSGLVYNYAFTILASITCIILILLYTTLDNTGLANSSIIGPEHTDLYITTLVLIIFGGLVQIAQPNKN